MKKHHYLLPVFCLIVCCVSIISCVKPPFDPDDSSRDVELPQNGVPVVNAGNQFAFDYLHRVLEVDPAQKNKMISPFSIYLALSMTYNGADNATRDSIKHALRLDNTSIEDLNNTCQALISQLPQVDNKIQLKIANSIYYNITKQQPWSGFLDIAKDYYHAGFGPLNFASNDALQAINSWVSTVTNQKIPKILDKIDPDALMYLLDAIYFKGDWQYQFDKNATRYQPFNLANNTSISTPFMNISSKGIGYYTDNSIKMVQLPYGKGNFSMYVILPPNNVPIADFASGLQMSSFQSWQSGLRMGEVNLSLPKFQYSYSISDMKPSLAKMGMGIAFTDKADFSKMYRVEAQITEAVHKTFIEVNEEGTEAAAVTGIGIGTTSVGPIFINIDRPFMYVIAEKSSNTVLFTGIVYNPAEH